MAKRYDDFVIGFITQRKLVNEPNFVHMTPGVNLSSEGDDLGQQYNTPEHVITKNGCDVIIVGRGIITAKDPAAEAKRYQEAGWSAHLKRVRA
jgi:orotidine 5'-phosphate decarboxylase subfamily 1